MNDDSIILQLKEMYIMKKNVNVGLTKTSLNEVSKNLIYFSSDNINKLDIKDNAMKQLFSDTRLVNVLRELAKV